MFKILRQAYDDYLGIFVFIVTLTSSIDDDQDGVCPGDTVVFTCVADTEQLQWGNDDGDTKLYNSPSQVNERAVVKLGGIFILKLINASNSTFVSTATVDNVSLNDDGVNITCTDDFNNPDDNSEMESITIGLYINVRKLH